MSRPLRAAGAVRLDGRPGVMGAGPGGGPLGRHAYIGRVLAAMPRIRGRGASIDLEPKKLQARSGARFKTHPKMTGSPDFAGWCRKIAVFSDGDFWYGYKCRGKKKRAGKCWRGRIERNLGRNRHVARRLKKEGRAAGAPVLGARHMQ